MTLPWTVRSGLAGAAAFGLWHGVLRRGLPEPWASAAFGGTLMSATLSLFPRLGRTPPPWR